MTKNNKSHSHRKKFHNGKTKPKNHQIGFNKSKPSTSSPLQKKDLFYQPQFITDSDKKEIMNYLESLQPIWEMRYSKSNPPPEGQNQRRLLRPVYWLGNWQFACLNYYHPPKGILNRCIEAEPYPPVLAKLVKKMEEMIKDFYLDSDIPKGWHLNTCLINFYGDQIDSNGKINDCARVGEHKDFEPGPVASLSFGERALIQFVKSHSTQSGSEVVCQQWLDDGGLQFFGGNKFKKLLFHRVQRVDRKAGITFKNIDLKTPQFKTRRINLTFRFVPIEHIKPYSEFPPELQEDIFPYMKELSLHSEFFKNAISET